MKMMKMSFPLRVNPFPQPYTNLLLLVYNSFIYRNLIFKKKT